MSAKKYTEHGLTGPMLKRLSQLANGHPHNHGTSLDALERRGLVQRKPEELLRLLPVRYQRSHELTPVGREALAQARREGW